MGIEPIAWECECGGIVPVENIVCSECKRLRPYKCDCLNVADDPTGHDRDCPNFPAGGAEGDTQ